MKDTQMYLWRIVYTICMCIKEVFFLIGYERLFYIKGKKKKVFSCHHKTSVATLPVPAFNLAQSSYNTTPQRMHTRTHIKWYFLYNRILFSFFSVCTYVFLNQYGCMCLMYMLCNSNMHIKEKSISMLTFYIFYK